MTRFQYNELKKAQKTIDMILRSHEQDQAQEVKNITDKLKDKRSFSNLSNVCTDRLGEDLNPNQLEVCEYAIDYGNDLMIYKLIDCYYFPFEYEQYSFKTLEEAERKMADTILAEEWIDLLN